MINVEFPKNMKENEKEELIHALEEKIHENPGFKEEDFELIKGTDGKYHWGLKRK